MNQLKIKKADLPQFFEDLPVGALFVRENGLFVKDRDGGAFIVVAISPGGTPAGRSTSFTDDCRVQRVRGIEVEV